MIAKHMPGPMKGRMPKAGAAELVGNPSQGLVIERLGSVLHMRLARADKRNALTMQMFSGLAAALQQAARDDTVRAVLWSGEGGSFCAGHDLQDFEHWPQTPDDPVPRFLQALAAFRKPLVVAVQGAAAGIGVTGLLYADWVCCRRRGLPT